MQAEADNYMTSIRPFLRFFFLQPSLKGKMFIEMRIVAAVWWLTSGTARHTFVATGFRKMFFFTH